MRIAVSVPAALVGLRLAFAGGAVAMPDRLAASVGVREDDQRAARPYVYALAAREVVLAAGYVVASVRGRGRDVWFLVMAGSDLFDAAVYEGLRQGKLLHSEPAKQSRNVALGAAGVYGLTGLVLD